MYIDLSDMKSGFCDRLRQITFCIAINNLQKKKDQNIEIYEIKTKECPYLFSDLLYIKKFKVKNIKRKKKINTLKMNPFNSSISLKTCLKYNKDVNINNLNLLKEWKNSYKLLEPKKKFTRDINKIKKKKKYVSVHLRLTDKLVSFKNYMTEIPDKDVIYKNQFKDFNNNILKLIPKNYNKIYLSSDESFHKNKLEKKLKDSFLFLNKKIDYKKKNYRQTSGEDFIVDLFAMVNSSMIITSTGGNVPLTARLISKRNINYIKWVDQKTSYKFLNFIRKFIFNFRKLLKL